MLIHCGTCFIAMENEHLANVPTLPSILLLRCVLNGKRITTLWMIMNTAGMSLSLIIVRFFCCAFFKKNGYAMFCLHRFYKSTLSNSILTQVYLTSISAQPLPFDVCLND